jgi:cell division protein FtsW (lipid II flippase)
MTRTRATRVSGVRRERHRVSYPLLLAVIGLVAGGVVMVYSASSVMAYITADDSALYGVQQAIFAVVGLSVMYVLSRTDFRLLRYLAIPGYVVTLLLLAAVLVPGIGTEINGARIWIHVGSFSFQPGEIAKLLLVVTFAGYLVLHRDALALAGRRVLFVDLPRGRDLGPILLMWLVSLGILVFQTDLGSSLLFFGLFLIMLYVATERAGWLIVGGGLFLGGALLAYRFESHVRIRVDTWLHPFDYYDDADGAKSYQLVESMFGMGWGGLLGRGFGLGMPQRIPRAESDFIMGALGEELGLTGVIAVIVLYGLIVERALRASLICRDPFGKLVAVGLGSVVALQVFVVIGGVTRLIPLTGLTTPFLSYGGSSLVANWVLIALLLRISDHARRPAPSLAVDDDADAEATQVVKMQVDQEANR